MADYAFEREDGQDIDATGKDLRRKAAEETKAGFQVQANKTQVDVNLNCDPGCLLVEDCQSFEGVSAKEFSKRTASNLCTLYKQLFDIKKAQEAKHGPDGEILEYTKSKFLVDMPERVQVLPREKPCPVDKPKTKWEKFREERGMAPRAKRSRLIFDPITNDWVPRWGVGSKQKIEDKHQWLMETRQKHVDADMDPFTYAKAEKRAKREKQDLAEVRNQVNAIKPGSMKDVQVLGKKKTDDAKPAPGSLKRKTDGERTDIRKREHKALMKSLTMAQMSTASMGRFDKKGKKEPDAPNSQKVLKKKSNKNLAELTHNAGKEKERNMKIFNMLQKKQDIKVAGVGKAVSKAHQDDGKMARKAKKKDDTMRRKANSRA